MPPRRIVKGKQAEVEPSRPRKRTVRHPNAHNIIFDNPSMRVVIRLVLSVRSHQQGICALTLYLNWVCLKK